MNIAFVASEGVPFSKTGGLADVVGALPRALASLGHQVSVFLPRYRQTKLSEPVTVVRSVTVPFDDQYRFASVVSGGSQGGVKFYFVEYPPYFDRDALYGTPSGDYPDNAERFALFSRTVLEATKILGVPDIFHCHDWQSALIPVLLRTVYAEDPAFRDVGTVFTIHNMGYQGLFPPDTLPLLMLPWDLFTMSKMEFFGQVNFLKGALTYSDFITTVSRKYSQEIQTAEYGFGLEGVLRDRASTVTGILNGVDYDEWSPQTDKFISREIFAAGSFWQGQVQTDLLSAFGVKNADAEAPGNRNRLPLRRSERIRPDRPDRGPPRPRRDDRSSPSAPATRSTKRCLFASTNSFPTRLPSKSLTTTPSPTRSKPAPTCSSCPRATSLAA